MRTLLPRVPATVFALLVGGLATAQGPYYVNGLTGLDAPTQGTSPGAPWKTIGYALAHVPPQTPTTSEVVYVEGNQDYSPTTNGEVFPIVPAYNVWIEGTFLVHGRLPVLRIPAGGTGFQLPGNQSFLRNEVTFRYLVLDGGSYGMQMGSTGGARHRPRVQDCTFQNQTVAAVSLLNLGNSGDDPRFFQSTFQGLGRGAGGTGIEAVARGNGGVVAPDVDECTFRDLGTAVAATAHFQAVNGIAAGTVRSCNLERCGTGVRIETGGASVHCNIAVSHSRFFDCSLGVQSILSNWTYSPAAEDLVTVGDSVFLACGIAIDSSSSMYFGASRCEVTASTFDGCTKGLRWQHNSNSVGRLLVQDSLFRGCATGLDLEQRYDTSLCLAVVQRSRLLDCGDGVHCWFDTYGSALTIASTSICGSTGSAVWFSGFGQAPAPGFSNLTMHGVTLADNSVAVTIPEAGPESSGSHLVLAGNTTDLVVPAAFPITYSCLQNSIYSGIGNLNLTDPQLVRPFYKLSPTSPCLDAGVLTAASPSTDYEGDPRAAVSQLGGSAIPDLGADEYVLAGSARVYGGGGFSMFNVLPRIAAASPNAPIGSAITVQLSQAIMPTFQVPANWALLSLSFREDSGTAPFDLAPFGLAGNYLWNDFAAAFPLQAVAFDGSAVRTHVLPNDLSLVGVVITHQWIVLMPEPYGVSTSDALRVTIGR